MKLIFVCCVVNPSVVNYSWSQILIHPTNQIPTISSVTVDKIL